MSNVQHKQHKQHKRHKECEQCEQHERREQHEQHKEHEQHERRERMNETNSRSRWQNSQIILCRRLHSLLSGPLYPRRSQWAEDSQIFLVRLVPRFLEPIASGRLSESTKDKAKSTEGNLTNKGLSPN